MIEHLAITVLVENTAGDRGLLGEHGLSFLIETESDRLLFVSVMNYSRKIYGRV